MFKFFKKKTKSSGPSKRSSGAVQHYNFHRPHQGIEGFVPADRFFQNQEKLKALIEKNIARNAEEMSHSPLKIKTG